MKKLFKKDFIDKYLPPYILIPMLVLILSNLVVYYGAKVFNQVFDRTYIDMSGGLDAATPVIPGFVFIYVAAFPF